MAGNVDLAKLVVRMEAQSAQYLKDLDKQRKATKKWQSKVSGNVGKVSKAFKGLAAAAGIAVLTKKIIANTRAQEQAVAQLSAGFKSVGGVMGQTVDGMIRKAGELQKVSIFGDEQIIEAQSQLVTFTQIAGDEFDRVTVAAMDLSTRMGTDLKSSVIQLGKALNDPVLGLSALSRSGIQFSESQKDMIKSMVESGDIIEAQKVILKELETQFGGSAAAARDTFGGALTGLSNAFNDLLEGKAGGAGLTEAKEGIEELTALLSDPEFVSGVTNFTTQAILGFSKLAGLIMKVADAWGTINGYVRDQISGGFTAMGEFAMDFVGASSPEYRAEQARKANQQNKPPGLGPIMITKGNDGVGSDPFNTSNSALGLNPGDGEGLDKDLELYINQLAAKAEAAEEFAETERRLEKETFAMKFGLASQALGLIASTAKEGSAIQKAALIASKAMSVAQIIMQTEVAAVGALALPPIGLGPIAGLGMASTIRTMGYMSAALVAGQALAGFESGGYTGNGGKSDVAGVVHGQEFVMNAAATARNRSALEAMNNGGSPGGNVVVNLIEDASKAGQVSQKETDEGTRIDIAVASLLDRGNNRTTRALESRYPNNRRQGT